LEAFHSDYGAQRKTEQSEGTPGKFSNIQSRACSGLWMEMEIQQRKLRGFLFAGMISKENRAQRR
jgi:hypothetical protein